MKKNKKKILIVLGCAAVVILAAIGVGMMGSKAPAVPAQAEAEDEIRVSALNPQVGDLEVTTEFIGKVQPDESVNIFPKMAGTVLTTYFKVGDTVRKGDLLYEIDPSDVQTQVQTAQAAYNLQVAQAESTKGSGIASQKLQSSSSFSQAKNGYKTALDNLDTYNEDTSLDKLEDDMDDLQDEVDEMEDYVARLQAAVKQAATVGSSKELQSLKEQLASAQTDYAKLKSTYETVKAQWRATKDGDDPTLKNLRTALRNAATAMETAEESARITEELAIPETENIVDATLASAKAGLDAAMKQMEYTKVTSPIDGVIELKSVEDHGQTAPTSPAYVVSNKEIMVVKFGVPASALEHMTVGDQVTIENGGRTYTGSVVEVGSRLDEQSGLFPCKARIDADPGELYSGISVKVTAPTAKAKEAVLLPVDCIYHDGGETFVYVLTAEGTARKTPVETGITNDETIEVLSGISTEDLVIDSWNATLVDGTKVKQVGSEGADSPQGPAAPQGEAQSEAGESSSQAGEAPGQEG